MERKIKSGGGREESNNSHLQQQTTNKLKTAVENGCQMHKQP